uniref:Transmembrane protein n=1 Tax=Macrostomum lignano TaxID=282301 RepID=A0A1I8FK41_9PLAT
MVRLYSARQRKGQWNRSLGYSTWLLGNHAARCAAGAPTLLAILSAAFVAYRPWQLFLRRLFFVPSLEGDLQRRSSTCRKTSPARTFMAAGSSAPELFSSLAAVSFDSDAGLAPFGCGKADR